MFTVGSFFSFLTIVTRLRSLSNIQIVLNEIWIFSEIYKTLNKHILNDYKQTDMNIFKFNELWALCDYFGNSHPTEKIMLKHIIKL